MDINEVLAEIDESYHNGRTRDTEELILKRAEQIRQEYGEDHVNYAVILSELSALYRGTSQFDKAKKTFLQVNRILEKAVGKQHPDFDVRDDFCRHQRGLQNPRQLQT